MGLQDRIQPLFVKKKEHVLIKWITKAQSTCLVLPYRSHLSKSDLLVLEVLETLFTHLLIFEKTQD